MNLLRLAGLALVVAASASCNSSGPCPLPDAGGATGACDCMYSGGGRWSCNEANIPACPGDAVSARTAAAPVACSYRGPTCVYCQGGANNAVGTAVWCSCGEAGGTVDASVGTYWSCNLVGGSTCTGP